MANCNADGKTPMTHGRLQPTWWALIAPISKEAARLYLDPLSRTAQWFRCNVLCSGQNLWRISSRDDGPSEKVRPWESARMSDEKPTAETGPPVSGGMAVLKWVTDLPNWAKVIAAITGLVAACSPFLSSVGEGIRVWRTPIPFLQAPFDVSNNYRPGGFMGDGAICATCVEINDAFRGKPRPGNSNGFCIRVMYTKPAGKGFAGVYWTSPDHNWGEQPGWKVVSASKVSFWAVGEKGGEIVEFKAGGIKSPGKPFFDTFEASLGKVRLENDWRRYEIDLRSCSLKDVIGAFAWSAADNWNAIPLVFYLDDIRYE